MKNPIRFSLLLSGLLALGGSSSAQDEVEQNMLGNEPRFIPRIVFTERVTPRLVAFRDPDFGEVSREVVSRTVSVAVLTASMASVDFSAIDADTEVSVSLGNLQHSGILGEASGWRPGRRRAVFPIFADDAGIFGDGDVEPRPRRIGTATYSWTNRQLTVLVVGVGIGSVIAEELSEGGETGRFGPQEVETAVAFGDGSGERPIFASGRVTTRTVRVGRGESAEEFDLTTVVASGREDRIRPVLTLTSPANNSRTTNPDFEITGTIFDGSGTGEIPSITVNGEDSGAGGDITQNENPRLPSTWVSTIFPEEGENVIEVTATDSSGNTVKRTITVTYEAEAPAEAAVSASWSQQDPAGAMTWVGNLPVCVLPVETTREAALSRE